MMIESYTSAQSMRVCQDGTENRLNIVTSLTLPSPCAFRSDQVRFYLICRSILTDGHRQEQTSYERWQEGWQEENVGPAAVANERDTRSFHLFSADPFSKKDWYDIKAPSNFETRNIGRTLVTRTTGTSLFELGSPLL